MIIRAARALAYLLGTFVAGIAGSVWVLLSAIVVAVVSLTRLGAPAFLVSTQATRVAAGFERRRAAWLLKQPIGSPYLPLPGATMWDRARQVAVQPATWRDYAWLVVAFPLGVAGAIAGLVAVVVDLAAVVAPAWAWSVPQNRAPHVVQLAMGTLPGRIGLTVLGLALFPVTVRLVGWLGSAQAGIARALLKPGEHRRLVERAAHLEQTRAKVVDAQAAELRRIERDLHDGAQARIVATGMTLALAQRKLKQRSPHDDLAEDLGRAKRQLDDALAELRRLVRGIHPPILSDRGLAAALAALAADSPLRVEIRGDYRFPPAVESAAYFVVAEGLANAAKHAGATVCSVDLVRTPLYIRVTLTDDGQGGANAEGTGLDGLRRRVEALDGTLTIVSPLGGPTHLTAEFPCAS